MAKNRERKLDLRLFAVVVFLISYMSGFTWQIFVALLLFSVVIMPLHIGAQNIRDRFFFRRLTKWKSRTEEQGQPKGELLALLRNITSASKGKIQWDDLFCSLDKVADGYCSVSEGEREGIRSFVASSPEAGKQMLRYARLSALKLDTFLEPGAYNLILKRGLAAVSMENARQEFRDTLIVLGKLHKSAFDAGFDPNPLYDEIADISSDEDPYRDLGSAKQPDAEAGVSMRSWIRGFTE